MFRKHFGKGKGLIDAKVGYIGGNKEVRSPLPAQKLCPIAGQQGTELESVPDSCL